MPASDLAISVRGLSKAYTIRHQHENQITLAEQALQFVRHPFTRPEKETFWALDDVSFDVRKGEVLGVIGRNGAGKSTLLKVLSRITAPTKGEVRLYGRVGSLLEVGTGFHPELTGRENVYLNGSILGMRRKEIDKQFDAIVDFAGVERFLDTPVKRYSSGMYVRLAFAVAAHLETEILLIDEVLAVGDAEFQGRAHARISQLTYDGRCILVVSHQLDVLQRSCDRGVLLAAGTVEVDASIDKASAAYLATPRERFRREVGHQPLSIVRADSVAEAYRPDEPKRLSITLGVQPAHGDDDYFLSVIVRNSQGQAVAHCDSSTMGQWFKGSRVVDFSLTSPFLMPGDYSADIAVCHASGVYASEAGLCRFRVAAKTPYPVPPPLEALNRDQVLPWYEFTQPVEVPWST